MEYAFVTCDVFTDTRFGGNPLAVLPDARGLSDEQMQRVAREFNYSESTFVFPPESGQTRKVRIFTPYDEVPFAGHPNVGTAFVLASLGELGRLDGPTSVTFEERAGLVPIRIEVSGGAPTRCELAAPERLSLGDEVPVELAANALSLSPGDFVCDTHPPRAASVGLRFLFCELRDLDALARVRTNASALDALRARRAPLAIHTYVRTGPSEIRARMLVAEGGCEDPATGSANCALAALLTQLSEVDEGSWHVTQGVEMGRPSHLYVRAEKRDGAIVSAHVGGQVVLVSEGRIRVD